MKTSFIDNNYFRELRCRQNQPITRAEIHLFENTRRYSDKEIRDCADYLKNVEECSEYMKDGKQLDLNGKISDTENDKLIIELEDLRSELDNKIEELKNIKNTDFIKVTDGNELEKKIEKKFVERMFIYQKKLILIDNQKNVLRLKYKEDLFDDMIFEFRKLYEWLDFRAAYLKFSDSENNEYIIDKTEVKTVIHFFDKLNKIKKDDEIY